MRKLIILALLMACISGLASQSLQQLSVQLPIIVPTDTAQQIPITSREPEYRTVIAWKSVINVLFLVIIAVFVTIFVTQYYRSRKKYNTTLFVDELLKRPAAIEKLIMAVEGGNSIDEVLMPPTTAEESDEPSLTGKQLSVSTGTEWVILNTDQIVRIKVINKFTYFYMLGMPAPIMVCKPLTGFENLLPANFIRINRSEMANTGFITSINRSGYIKMKDEHTAAITKSGKAAVHQYFKSISRPA